MSHHWSERLRGIEQALGAQNERLEAVKETLAELPKQLSIELGSDWRDAFEDAIETSLMARPRQCPLHGAIRG